MKLSTLFRGVIPFFRESGYMRFSSVYSIHIGLNAYLLIPSSSTFRRRGDPREPSTFVYPLLSFPPLSMLLFSFLSPLVTLSSMFSLVGAFSHHV